ncbi:MAG: hypothetical protein ACM3VV_06950 [Deltaproteobacteria bacterium]
MIIDYDISLILYYEVPEDKREEVKQKFENFARSLLPSSLQQRNIG